MAPFILPLAGILGSLWLLARPDAANQAAPGVPGPARAFAPPVLTPELRAHLSETRPDGVLAFRSLEKTKLMAALAQRGIALVQSQARSQVWQIVPWQQGAVVAAEAVRTWQARGFAVAASLAAALQDPNARAVLCVVGVDDLPLVTTAQSSMALLAEPVGVAKRVAKKDQDPHGLNTPPASPAPFAAAKAAEAAGPVFDAGLPAEIAADVKDVLSDGEIKTVNLRSMASELSAFPLASKALLARADVLDLKRKLAKARQGEAEEWVAAPMKIVNGAATHTETPAELDSAAETAP